MSLTFMSMIAFSTLGTFFGFHSGAAFSYDTSRILQVYGLVGALMADVELCLTVLSPFSYILELLSEVFRGRLIGHHHHSLQACDPCIRILSTLPQIMYDTFGLVDHGHPRLRALFSPRLHRLPLR